MANEITPVENQSIIDYGTWEVEAAQEEREQLNRAAQQYMKLEIGSNRVRFLPPPVGRRSPFVTVFQHFIRFDGIDRPFVFNCPRMMERKPCPACIKADKLRQRGNRGDLEEADGLWPGRRVFANVINRKNEDSGPVILGFGKTIHESLLALRMNPDAGGDFTHPIHGFDVIIERKGSGKNDTRYIINGARMATPLGNLEWINTQPNIAELAKVLTAQEIIEAMRKHQENAAEAAAQAQTQAAPASSFADDATSFAPTDGGDDDIPF